MELENKFTCNCISCKPSDADEIARTFYDDAVCKAVLRTDNQCWLGRFVVVPKKHLDPLVFWNDPLSTAVMQVYVKCAQAVIDAFGATCVQMAQLGGLTVDENNNPTVDQRYQHAHIHGIPRYAVPPVFNNKIWYDPQFQDGKFSALNIDPKAGLPKVVPTPAEIEKIVNKLKRKLGVIFFRI